MQVYTSLGKKWESNSDKSFFKSFIKTFPVELISLFSFIIVVQQFIVDNSYAKSIYLSWTIFIYLMYKLRSHCNSEYFNKQLNLNIDELIDLFHQLPNCDLFKDVLFSDNDHSSIDWINYLIIKLWPKLINYFDKRLKKINLNVIKFFSLENFSIGSNAPIIESLNSSIVSKDREQRLILKFNLYWFAKSLNDNSKRLVCLKFLHHSVGSLVSFCFKCSCQIEFKFIHWQINEDLQLKNIKFSLSKSPSINYINSTGLICFLDNLQLIRPIILIYLNDKFLYPKNISFKFNLTSQLIKKELRRPQIGLPVALFCIDIIQAENIPSQKYRKSDLDKQTSLIKTTITKTKSRKQIKKRKKYTIDKQLNQLDNTINELKKLEPKSTKFGLLNCLNYYTANVYCKIKIFNQQFESSSIVNKNPFWNFRSLIPIFSHNQHTIEQLNKYHSLFNKDNEIKNPIDLNASFYQDKKFDNLIYVKKFISYDLLENLSINIQIIDKNNQKLIADFSLNDSSHYFLDNEFNGQSIWINSITPNVITNNLDASIKLNVRFTFLTLNQTLNPIILSNAYLGNRLAFPIGVLLVFVDSLIGLNEGYIDSLRLNLNSEFGFQFIFQLGNQTLYTSISTDLSFIWENELLFSVYSLDFEKITIKLVARSLNTNESNLITLSSSKLNLSNLIYQPEFKQQIYCPFVLKFNKKIQLKLLLSFRITYFTTKLIVNCLRNAKVAEEDILIKGKQSYVEDKLKSNLKIKSYQEEIPEPNLFSEKLKIDDDHQDSNDEVQSNDLNDEITINQPNININSSIDVLVKMRWPKSNKFVIEIVNLDCSKFLALYQIYSIDVYLNCALREKEKILQIKRTKNFQLKNQTVNLNQELEFNCISKPLTAYHLNLSLHEKRIEEYSKIAEIYTPLPSLILASGQIDKKLMLNLTPMYLNFWSSK